MTKLNIIIASTRPTRKGPAVAKWVEQFARTHGKFEVELVDIAAFGLPVFDEPEHPSTRKYQHDHTKKWSASVASADAYVIILPEYNHHIPPSLVNAMNYVYHEWNYKPVGLVSYGGQSGGLRSAEAARLFLNTFKLVAIVESVAIPFFDKMIDPQGVFLANEALDAAAGRMLDELFRWSEALQVLRS
jgi:NAD(P)H-dependent FMN reductase